MKLYNIAVSAAQNFASTSKRKGASREFARVPNGELAALLPGEPGRRRRRVGRRVRRRGGGDGPDHVGAAIAARSRPRAASDHRGVFPGVRARGAGPVRRRRLPPVHTLERVATRRGRRRGGRAAHGHTEPASSASTRGWPTAIDGTRASDIFSFPFLPPPSPDASFGVCFE